MRRRFRRVARLFPSSVAGISGRPTIGCKSMDGGESSGRPKCLNSFSEHINVVRQTSLEEKVLFVGKIGDN